MNAQGSQAWMRGLVLVCCVLGATLMVVDAESVTTKDNDGPLTTSMSQIIPEDRDESLSSVVAVTEQLHTQKLEREMAYPHHGLVRMMPVEDARPNRAESLTQVESQAEPHKQKKKSKHMVRKVFKVPKEASEPQIGGGINRRRRVQPSSVPEGAKESSTARKSGGIERVLRRARYANEHSTIVRRTRQAKQKCAEAHCQKKDPAKALGDYKHRYVKKAKQNLRSNGKDEASVHHQTKDLFHEIEKRESQRKEKNKKDKAIAERYHLERRRIFSELLLSGISAKTLRKSNQLQRALKEAISKVVGAQEDDIVIDDVDFSPLSVNSKKEEEQKKKGEKKKDSKKNKGLEDKKAGTGKNKTGTNSADSKASKKVSTSTAVKKANAEAKDAANKEKAAAKKEEDTKAAEDKARKVKVAAHNKAVAVHAAIKKAEKTDKTSKAGNVAQKDDFDPTKPKPPWKKQEAKQFSKVLVEEATGTAQAATDAQKRGAPSTLDLEQIVPEADFEERSALPSDESLLGFHINTDAANADTVAKAVLAVLQDPKATGLEAAFQEAALKQSNDSKDSSIKKEAAGVHMTEAGSPEIEYVVPASVAAYADAHPLVSPTPAPTHHPTPTPTAAPTATQTHSPTATPTKPPSAPAASPPAPTPSPTTPPTASPTAHPTKAHVKHVASKAKAKAAPAVHHLPLHMSNTTSSSHSSDDSSIIWIIVLLVLAAICVVLLVWRFCTSPTDGVESDTSSAKQELLMREAAELKTQAAQNSEAFQLMQMTRVPVVRVKGLREQMAKNVSALRSLEDRCRLVGNNDTRTLAEELQALQKELNLLLDSEDIGPKEPINEEAALQEALDGMHHGALKQAVTDAGEKVGSGQITEPPSLEQARKILGDMDRAANHTYFGCKGTRGIEDGCRGRKALDKDADYHRKNNSNLLKDTSASQV